MKKEERGGRTKRKIERKQQRIKNTRDKNRGENGEQAADGNMAAEKPSHLADETEMRIETAILRSRNAEWQVSLCRV